MQYHYSLMYGEQGAEEMQLSCRLGGRGKLLDQERRIWVGILAYALGVGIACWCVVWGSLAHAINGPSPGAATAQTVKLPSGPGSIRGLVEDPSVDVFTGQVAHQVPLELPGARRDFAPEIALKYRGDLGNGVLGIGWYVDNLRVRRSTRLGVPQFTEEDELELSGVQYGGRLIRIPDGTYRVEGQGNKLKIVAHGDGYSLYDGTGMVYSLGTQPSTRQQDGDRVVAWHVETVTDTAGQTIHYTYRHDQGQTYLTGISWGPRVYGVSAYRVTLSLEERPDIVTSYRQGISVTTHYRVSQIDVFSFGTLLRRYELSYDNTLSLSRLSQVRMSGRGGYGTLPPVRFGYAPREAPRLRALTGQGNWRLNKNGVSLLDVDGDGLSDLIRIREGDHRYRRNLGTHFGEPVAITGAEGVSMSEARLVDIEGRAQANLVTIVGTQWRSFRLFDGTWIPLGYWPGTDYLPHRGDKVALADINGDGRTDAIRWTTEMLLVYFGAATRMQPRVFRPRIGSQILPGKSVLWADQNGDGLADALRISPDWVGLYVGQGDGRFLPRKLKYWPSAARITTTDNYRFADLNRDGLLDLLVVASGRVLWFPGDAKEIFSREPQFLEGPEFLTSDVVVTMADVNGNGSQDVVWSSPYGMWMLDMAGSTTAGMLTWVDNGMGKRITIEYENSAVLSLADEQRGEPWRVAPPVSVPVAVRTEKTVGPQDPLRVTEYHVRNGFWDAQEFRFGGFLEGRTIERGDESENDRIIDTRFHSGSARNRVLRGKPVVIATSSGTGKTFTVQTNRWQSRTVPGLGEDILLRTPLLTRTQNEHWEGVPMGQSPPITQTLYSYDWQGRLLTQHEFGREDQEGDERILENTYATDNEREWIQGKVCEQRLREGDGRLVSHVRTYYGDLQGELPLCETGLGWEHRREKLLTISSSGEAAAESGRWVTEKETHYNGYGNPIWIEEGGISRALRYDSYELYAIEESQFPGSQKILTWSATWNYMLGQIETVTDPSGITNRVAYDLLGRVRSIAIDPYPPHLYYHYEWERTYPRTTTYSYDRLASTLPVTLPFAYFQRPGWRESVDVRNGAGEKRMEATRLQEDRWIVTQWQERDARGNASWISLPYYHDSAQLPEVAPVDVDGIAYTHDALSRVLVQQLPNGAERRTTYGALHQVVETAELAPVTTELDGLARVIAAERTVGGIRERTETHYDAADQIIAMHTLAEDGKTVASTFTYDTLGRVIAADDPDIGPRTLRWDDGGRLLETHNGVGQTVSYHYDDIGRLQATLLDGVETYRYHYEQGRLAWIEEPEGYTELIYDDRGQQTEVVREIRGRKGGWRQFFGASGLLRATRYDDGFSYTYLFDRAGRTIGINWAHTVVENLPQPLWRAKPLDASGRPLAETYGNGVKQRTVRDEQGKPTQVQIVEPDGTIVYDVTIDRSPLGVVHRVHDNDQRGLDHTSLFDHDGAGRLVYGQIGSGEEVYEFTYGYDALQNMTHRTAFGLVPRSFASGAYEYGTEGAGPRQLRAIVGDDGHRLVVEHDNAGRTTYDGARELTYNSKDQLIRVAYERDGQSVETNHVYGYDGQRVVTESPAGVSIWFGPDLVEHNGVVDHYVKVGDRLVARVRSSATNNETSSLDSPVQTEITYLHRSMGAGPVGISNASGLLTHERRYEPFGHGIDASISVEGHSSPQPSEVDFLQEPFNVLNKPTDSSTGLSYHGARWYMSSQARWLTPDALVQIPNLRFASSPWELHPYQYVGHRPLELWDPDGNDGVSWKDSVWVTFQNAVDFTGSLIKAAVIQGPCPCGIKPGARREMNDFRSRRADRLRRLESRSLSKSSKSVRGGTSAATRGGAQNIVNGRRLAAQLTRQEAASVFTKSGFLRPQVIAGSREIIPGMALKNKGLIGRLTADGSKISDWAKMSTQSFKSPSGSFQVHFYQNLRTGAVHYGDDFKAVFNHGGAWP